MTEKRHVPTHPGENVSPEIVAHPMENEPGAHAQQDGRGLLTVVLTGLVSVLLLTLIVACVEAYFYNVRDEQIVKKQDHANPALVHLFQAQRQQLKPHWINRKKGLVAVGIRAAEAEFISQSAAPRKSAPAGGGNGPAADGQ